MSTKNRLFQQPAKASEIFIACDLAIARGMLIRRANKRDKEFHYQDWFAERLVELMLKFDPPERNTYPDFRLVETPEGFETKALAFPGREADYDANSQMPSGFHNGRTIYYAFGRYPKDPEEDEYPVIDFVLCHGDFLNADHEYEHQNRSFRGFGTYGDIMVRDRKMYVAPTPFALLEGATGQTTLILPADQPPVSYDLKRVGDLVRVECDKVVTGYRFDLRENSLIPELESNPHGGKEHRFTAYRLASREGPPVKMRTPHRRT
jgi:hypothetical protein